MDAVLRSQVLSDRSTPARKHRRKLAKQLAGTVAGSAEFSPLRAANVSCKGLVLSSLLQIQAFE